MERVTEADRAYAEGICAGYDGRPANLAEEWPTATRADWLTGWDDGQRIRALEDEHIATGGM